MRESTRWSDSREFIDGKEGKENLTGVGKDGKVLFGYDKRQMKPFVMKFCSL